MDTGVLTSRLTYKGETGVLTLRYRDKVGDRSTHIALQRLVWRHEYSHLDTEIRVETRVLAFRFRDKSGKRSTYIDVQR